MKTLTAILLLGLALWVMTTRSLPDLPSAGASRQQVPGAATAPVGVEDQRDGFVPNPVLTPGGVRPEATKETLCDKNFRTGSVRNVSNATKEIVRRRYDMVSKRDMWCNTDEACEIDHLIPLVIGGSNAVANLWPQPYQGVWNAHQKDKMEVRAKELVCSGRISLKDAQDAFRGDWRIAFKTWFPAGK